VVRITGISSMATKKVLADLCVPYRERSGHTVAIESVGGVDAVKRVEGGEVLDAVFLAANAIDKLVAAGRLLAGSRVDLVRSGVSVAVRAGAPRPDISSEEAVKQAVRAAKTISYSTGPSGVHLVKLFERWGIADEIKPRIVQAPPGVPVGSLVAKGEVELGFQQLSELMFLQGIDVIGPLPDAIQIITVFSGALCVEAAQPAAARDMLAFMASPEAVEIKRRNGMEPA
jgi:molybdate transport system substrate-binding protein